MPNGGLRMVETGLTAYGYELDPQVREIFTRYRKTHNDGVFDAYTAADPRRPQGRRHHRAPRRLRPRPHHRRLPAGAAVRRGPADRRQAADKAGLDGVPSTDDVIRDREELAEQVRALGELRRWPPPTATTSPGRPRTAREAVQWLYFGYLAAIKEQNGAAMSLGRTSTFLDVYLQRDLAAGTLDEAAPRS